MSILDTIKKTLSEAEGGGTSIESKKSLESQKKRAQILLKSADLRLKQQKEREALARQKSAVKEEAESLEELSSKKLSDYSDKASDDVHRLDKEGNTAKANKRFDGVVRASDKITDNGKKLRGAPMKEEEKKMKGEDPCWKGYEMIGKKMKNGKEVPNCVPKESVKEESELAEEVAGWIAMYNGQKFEIKKDQAKDLYSAKLKAIEHFKVPKSKQGLLAIKPAYNEEVELEESSKYQIYHPSYTSAVQHAVSQVEKQGLKIDMDDYERKVAFGPRKPSAGKTNSFSITLMDKNGKISKKQLHMQVYGMEGGKYELNMYTEEVDLDEGSGSKEKQKTPYRDINSPEYRSAVDKQKQQMAKDKDAESGKKLLAKMKKEEVDLDEGAVKSTEKLVTLKHKDSGKELRVVATAIEKYKRMGYELVEGKSAYGPITPNIKASSDKAFKAGVKDGKSGAPKSKIHMSSELMRKTYLNGYEQGKKDQGVSEEVEQIDELSKETLKSYDDKASKTSPQKSWVNRIVGIARASEKLKKKEVKEAEEFKQGGKPLEKKFEKSFKAMGVDAKVKMKTVNNVSINEEEKSKKSFKDMKKKVENTSDKDIKAGEKLSGKQEPIDLTPTVDNNK